MYGTGGNGYGQLGLNDIANRNTFTEISSGWNVSGYDGIGYYNLYSDGLPRFSGGEFHSLAIDESMVLQATGYNLYGQLGCGDHTARDEFETVDESKPTNTIDELWDFVVLGQFHTMALKIVPAINITEALDEPQVWPLDRAHKPLANVGGELVGPDSPVWPITPDNGDVGIPGGYFYRAGDETYSPNPFKLTLTQAAVTISDALLDEAGNVVTDEAGPAIYTENE